ncbi:MAG TPA: hypothetical protein VHW44_33245 [Pseudonocardiaceae bacterium]|nr:hypothetical protein [Pseudonocardiaceae bacterium]
MAHAGTPPTKCALFRVNSMAWVRCGAFQPLGNAAATERADIT